MKKKQNLEQSWVLKTLFFCKTIADDSDQLSVAKCIVVDQSSENLFHVSVSIF